MRKEMVTRTVIGTQVAVKVVNKETDEISRMTLIINKSFTDASDKKLLNAIKKALPEDVVFIGVEALAPMNKLYGLDTALFMQYAVELDPDTRKPINA